MAADGVGFVAIVGLDDGTFSSVALGVVPPVVPISEALEGTGESFASVEVAPVHGKCDFLIL